MSASEHEPGIARRAHRRQAERAASLGACFLPGETVVAHQGAIMVTDHRLLFAWKLSSGWHSDAISFDEITGWSLGRQHDKRPMLRLEHPTHIRTGRVAAHHVLWFSWGDAEAGLPHDDITLTFAGKRDRPSLRLWTTFSRSMSLGARTSWSRPLAPGRTVHATIPI